MGLRLLQYVCNKCGGFGIRLSGWKGNVCVVKYACSKCLLEERYEKNYSCNDIEKYFIQQEFEITCRYLEESKNASAKEQGKIVRQSDRLLPEPGRLQEEVQEPSRSSRQVKKKVSKFSKLLKRVKSWKIHE